MESFVNLNKNDSNETKFKSICYKLCLGTFLSIHLRFLSYHTKGQIKSEWINEIINFPKNDPKNLKDFCPMYCKNSQARNPSNFLQIHDFMNSF